jgi:hypothetical protein
MRYKIYKAVNKSFIKLFYVLFFLFQLTVFPCTSAIISGKASPDGKPMLWKHRDAYANENKLMFFKGLKYNFIGVINSVDSLGSQVWMGSNDIGFSIMNTGSVNLDTICCIPVDQEGFLMKKALAECATLSDFEDLLEELVGKWGVSSNFGVLDAQGGTAYYEVDHYSYKKYDANDSQIAPDGYIIRTNFSVRGKENKGHGYFRFESAKKIFGEYYNQNKNISLDFVLKIADRNMYNSVSKIDVYKAHLPEDNTIQNFIPFRDFIVRNVSVSSMIIQGVKEGENPALTTLWTVLGFPLTTLVTPVWVACGENIPSVTTGEIGKTAPINRKSLQLKQKCFPITYGNGTDYLNVSAIINKKGDGIIQKLFPYEKEIIDKAQALVKRWAANSFQKEEAEDYYRWLDDYINSVYQKEFGI